MNVSIYKDKNKLSGYIIIPQSTDIEKIDIPSNINFDKKNVWKSLDLQVNDTRIALDTGNTISQINTKGYAYVEAEIQSDFGH